jgi:hypothetical protein
MEQFVFGHQPPSVLHQVAQHRKGLGPEWDQFLLSPQLLVGQIEMKGRKENFTFSLHFFPLPG